jgi:predicted dehydrogenase
VQQAKILAESLIASGELGRVVLLRGYCYTGEFQVGSRGFVMTEETRPEGLELWPIAPGWLPPALHQDYAAFINVFIHDINLIRYLAGHTPSVSAVDLRRPNGRLVMLDFGDYAGVLEMAEIPFRELREGVEIFFERGCLRVDLPPPLLRNVPARVELYRGDRHETIRPAPPWSWAFRRQAEAFIADITADRTPLASGEDSLQDMKLVEEIWRRHCM